MDRNIQSGIAIELSELLELRGESRQLDLAPKGKVLATRSGGHLSRFRGRGMEFDESRPYQPGDDIRNMDWRVTARRAGNPHVKLFREERERPVWLLVDLGPSMRFGTKVAFKSVIAARTAALLGWAASDRGDRVGGMVFDESKHFASRPIARTRGLLPILHALVHNGIEAANNANQGNKGYHNIMNAALKLQQLTRPGSLVFILSDFTGVSTTTSTWLSQLSFTCELVLVHIYDPIEKTSPPPGYYPVTNGFHRGIVNTVGISRQNLWQQHFADKLAFLEALARNHKAHLLNLCTSYPVGDTLIQGLRPRLANNGIAGIAKLT